MNPDLDLTLQRVIRAPRTAVWRAWIDPSQLEQWWVPAPTVARVDRLEARPGASARAWPPSSPPPPPPPPPSPPPGGWLVPHLDQQFVRRASEWLDLADGLLLGRRTYEAFARDWPQITDPDDPFTERMNSLPKYVVTNTPIEARGIRRPCCAATRSGPSARSGPGRGGSCRSTGAPARAALLSAGLVDTLRLVVAPTIRRGAQAARPPGRQRRPSAREARGDVRRAPPGRVRDDRRLPGRRVRRCERLRRSGSRCS